MLETMLEKLVLMSAGAVLMIVMAVFLGALCALPVYLLWNAVVPDLLGLKSIGFFQAWGLNVLCGLLFKSSTSSSS